MSQYLVMDMGGTFVKYALMDEKGTILEKSKVSTVLTSKEAFFESLQPLFDQYRGKVDGCAVSMPGRIDTKNGIAITAGAYTMILSNTPVASIIEERLGVPTTIGNDGKCAAAAEAWSGALKDVPNGVVVVFGTGIGGGVVIDHKVYMGSKFAAGELSILVHDGMTAMSGFTVDPTQDLFRYGGTPLWFSYASASAITSDYANMTQGEKVDGVELFKRLRAGDEEAKKALQHFADATAVGIVTLQSVLDVDRVAIGGGISGAPELVEAVRESVHKWWNQPYFTLPVMEPEVVPCKYGNDANLLGALSLHLSK